MAVQKMQLSEWEKLTAGSEGQRAKLSGDSPGGVAVQLGCSRQFVHSLIRRGLLDAVAVYKGRSLCMYVIPQPSIDRYLKGKRAYLEALQSRYT